MNRPTVSTPFNFRAPIFDQVVDATGLPTEIEQKFRTNLQRVLLSLATINVSNYGARGDGNSDDTAAFQQAIDQCFAVGGGTVLVPRGIFSINSVFIKPNSPPIAIVGQGATTTILKRRGQLAPSQGLIDISASNISLSDFSIDGDKTVPLGLRYGADFNGIGGNDPMADSLTRNTSVWVHGNTQMFTCQRVMFQHAAGYSILLDAMNGDISDVEIVKCWFQNNRPTLFGTNPADLNYGSWNGGVFAKGDGRTAQSGIVAGLLVTQCRFKRNTGNCLWSHLYGLTRLHQDFRFISNYFEDCGLDGILVAGVTGGVVDTNVFRRIGYITTDDVAKSIPRWLANLNATALDSAGVVKGCPYTNNSFLSVNGGCMDLDGHGESVIAGNVARVPFADEPEYLEDSIAISGPNNNGSASYGVNIGNSSQTAEGAEDVDIGDNSFINLPGGSVRLYAGRFCLVHGNLLDVPAVVINPPIAMGPTGAGQFQRCFGNKVWGNHIRYSPGSQQPVVLEDDALSAFLGTEKNYVFENSPIVGNGNAIEFTKSPNSGSTPPTPVTGAAVAGAVTLNGVQGIATSEALTTAAGAVYTLTITNSVILAGSNVLVTVGNGTNTAGAAVLQSVAPANGSVVIKILNNGSVPFNGTLKIQFLVQ